MSVTLTQPSSNVDPYLRQVAPLLQTYWLGVREITNRDLVLKRKLLPLPEPVPPVLVITGIPAASSLHIEININVPVVISELSEGRSRRRSRRDNNSVSSNEEALSLVELISVYNHKLLKVVEGEIKSVEELKDKESTLSRKVNKLTELKTGLDEFTIIIDKILKFYSAQNFGFSVPELPSVDELKTFRDKVCKMKKSLKLDELHAIFSEHDKEFVTTEENILCSILGINDEIGDWLFGLDIGLRMHQTDLYFLQKIIDTREEDSIENGILANVGLEGLVRSLETLHFTPEVAQSVSCLIPDELVDLQKPSYWANRYLEHAFSHHPLLSNLPRFPCENEDKTLDDWFDYPIQIDKRCEPDETDGMLESPFPVKMINITSKESKGNILVDDLLVKFQQDKEVQILFHGTTHKGARSILQEGISLEKGKIGQDFSSGDGFYLSYDYENAKTWSRAGRSDRQAVVIFKVERSLFNTDQGGLDLTEDRKTWEQVVALCRNGYNDRKLKRKLFKDVTFVKGPFCRNPIDVIRGDHPQGFGRSDELQLCIRDEYFAEKFGSIANIIVVFF